MPLLFVECVVSQFIYHQSHTQTEESIGMEVIYFENNQMKTGKIIEYDPTISKGKHTIQLKDSTKRIVSLKSAVKKKQVVLIEKKRYTLRNIQYIKNYLLLYLSSDSLRKKCWKPTSFNQSVKEKKKDKFEYHSTLKSSRPDWMLQQKFAYADCKNGDWNGFLRMMIGACYELVDDKLICVTDVICTRGSQLIHYIEVYK